MLSPANLLVVTALLTFMMMLVLVSLRRSGVPGVRDWIWANGLELVALLCYLTTGLLPTVVPVVIGNTLLAAALCLVYTGFRRFFSLSLPVRSLAAALVVLAVALIALRFYVDNFTARVLVTSLFHGGLDLLIALTIIRNRPQTISTYGHYYTAGLSLLLALGHFSRCVLYLQHPEIHNWLSDYSFLNLAFLTLGAIVVPAFSMGAVVMVHDAMLTAVEETASRDYLTNTLSRRAFIETATKQMALANRNGRPLSLLLLDIDHFKSINDRYGHAVGDEVLRDFALIMQSALRAVDTLGRLGGEEFGLLLYGASPAEARAISERLRALVEANTIRIGDGQATYTMSGGLAHWYPDESLQDLTLRADNALYEAKAAGRNRIVLSQRTVPTAAPETQS